MSEVRDRLISLIDSARLTEGRVQSVMSISELAKRAKVSRATIYRYYPDVVSYLRSFGGKGENVAHKEQHVKNGLLKAQLNKQKALVGVLARACSELLIEVIELKASCADQLEEKDLKIKYLEDKLREVGSLKPRLVK